MPTLRAIQGKIDHAARRILRRGDRITGSADTNNPQSDWWAEPVSDEDFVKAAYQRVLARPADPAGLAIYVRKLEEGWSRQDLIAILEGSEEAKAGPTPRLATEAFHGGRITWIRSLPRARRILDLGGTALGDNRGAMVVMGYPHDFDELVIVELPPDERHELYRVAENEAVQTERGPVRYLYRPMTELADLPDGSFDLICSAQTFEHIYPDEGKLVLSEVRRLLGPGGVLALDTPNLAVSGIEARDRGTPFINPDHKIEYTHRQMVELFDSAGLEVVRQHGIGYMPRTVRDDRFIIEELIEYPGLYDDIEACYTLAYLAKAR